MRLRGHAVWLVLVWAVACSVYDESLLTIGEAVGGGGSGSAGGGAAGSSGSSAASGGGGSSGAGSGGSAGLTSTAGSSGVQDGGAGGQGPLPALELIDDMEDTNTNVALIADRNGRWVTDHDADGGTTTPEKTMFALLVTALTGVDARDGSAYGVRLRAEGFQNGTWGAFVGLHFKAPDSTLYDAAAYCGIHFWAKRSADSSPILLEVRIPDEYTIPAGGFCVEQAAAGGAGGAGPGLCYDHHAAMLTLTAEWAEYSVHFSDMQQGSWVGYEQSPLDGIDVGAITSIEFFLNRPMIYELWVDDISFINKPAGGTCP